MHSQTAISVFNKDVCSVRWDIDLDLENNSWVKTGESGEDAASMEQTQTIRDRILKTLTINAPNAHKGPELLELTGLAKENRGSFYSQISRMVNNRLIASRPALGDKRYNLYSLPCDESSNLSFNQTLNTSPPPPSPSCVTSTNTLEAEAYMAQGVENSHHNSHHQLSGESSGSLSDKASEIVTTPCTENSESESALNNVLDAIPTTFPDSEHHPHQAANFQWVLDLLADLEVTPAPHPRFKSRRHVLDLFAEMAQKQQALFSEGLDVLSVCPDYNERSTSAYIKVVDHLPPRVVLLNPADPDYSHHLKTLGSASGVALDCETFGVKARDGLHPWDGEIRLISLYPWFEGDVTDIDDIDTSYLVDLGGHLDDRKAFRALHAPTIEAIASIIQNPQQKVVGHNLHFDLRFLATKLGIHPATNVACTMLGAKMFWGDYGGAEDKTKKGDPILAGGYSLRNLAKRLLNIELNKTEQTSDWGAPLTKSQIEYAAHDAFESLLFVRRA